MSRYTHLYLLFILVLLEIICHGLIIEKIQPVTISVIYFLLGLGIGLFPLLSTPSKEKKEDAFYYLLTLGGFACIAMLLIHYSKNIIGSIPLDFHMADMLPVIEVMGVRFLKGQPVYASIPEIWGGMTPIYLPAMWMPFLPSLLFHFDMRWTSIILVLIGIFVLLHLPSERVRSFKSLSIFIPLLALLTILCILDQGFISLTEEGIVIGFYLILVYALVKKHPVLTGLALVLCLLSRPSAIWWALMYYFFLTMYYPIRYWSKIWLSSAGFGLFLITVSGALFHLDQFYKLPSTYLKSILENKWKYESVINENLGLAKLFPYEKLDTLYILFSFVVILIPFVLLLWYYFKRKKPLLRLFALGSLKLSLVVFFNLLILPYSYLFYTSTFLSLAILYIFLESPFSKDYHRLSG